MGRIVRWLERIVGPTAEDWFLGLMMVAMIAMTVVGVRGCERDHDESHAERVLEH